MRYSVEVKAFGHVSVQNVEAWSPEDAEAEAIDRLVDVTVRSNPMLADVEREERVVSRFEVARASRLAAQRIREATADF